MHRPAATLSNDLESISRRSLLYHAVGVGGRRSCVISAHQSSGANHAKARFDSGVAGTRSHCFLVTTGYLYRTETSSLSVVESEDSESYI